MRFLLAAADDSWLGICAASITKILYGRSTIASKGLCRVKKMTNKILERPVQQESNPEETQHSLFDPAELERLSHPRDHGFFALLFPRAEKNTHADVAALQGRIFQHLPDEDAAVAATIHLGDGPNLLAVAADITRQRAAGEKRAALAQRCFGLQDLEAVVRLCQGRDEHYISQGDFLRPNRLAINLLRTSSVWLDLDIYKSPLSHLAHDESLIANMIRRHCILHNIPLPSVIIRSGRGYYVKWHTEALPAAAFPRVRAVMVFLCKKFEVFGADPSATDASRVLRVGGSTHSKTGDAVRFLWKNEITEYVFDQLANAVLPMPRTPEQIERWKQGREVQKKIDARIREQEAFYKSLPYDPRATRAQTLAFQPGSREQSLWWSRMLDLKKLVELRGEALDKRELVMFMMMNALAWSGQATAENFWRQAQEISALMPRQKTMDEPKDTLSTMYRRTVAALEGKTAIYKGEETSQLYFYKNSTLIERLGITSDEMPYLLTIIDSTEHQRRNTLAHQEARRAAGSVPREQYEAGSAERRALAARLRQEGLSWAEVGKTMGVTATAARLLAVRNTPQ